MGGVRISSDTVVLVGVLAVECFLLYLLLQRTKLGLAFRAVASNPESSRLLGRARRAPCSCSGWALAAALGALAGALVVPTTPALTAASMQSILVFSFAAAALGGFDSPLGAVVGGLIVGVAERARRPSTSHALHDIELIVPFGIILAGAAVPAGRPVRHRTGGAGVMTPPAAHTRRLRRRGRWSSRVLAYLPQHYGPTDTKLWAQALYIGIAAMGLNLLTGYNGQVSIGHGAFFGVGAYTTALLMHDHGW